MPDKDIPPISALRSGTPHQPHVYIAHIISLPFVAYWYNLLKSHIIFLLSLYVATCNEILNIMNNCNPLK